MPRLHLNAKSPLKYLQASLGPSGRQQSILLDEPNPILNPELFTHRKSSPTSTTGPDELRKLQKEGVAPEAGSSNPYCE